MNAIELIAAERKRQIEVKKWTPEHDATMHYDSELAIAAAAYALPERFSIKDNLRGRFSHFGFEIHRKDIWPFGYKFWRPNPDDRIRELAKAGALIVAEIERLQRIEEKEAKMREIRFRGRTPQGKWVYGSLVFDAAGDARIASVDSSGEGLVFDKVIPETIGQFTGMKDKSGKDAYEGDIVQGTEDRNSNLTVIYAS